MDTSKSFELERYPGYSRLEISPNLNAFRWEDVERSAAEILGALQSGRSPAVLVDLSSLDYLGSAQLTLLVRVWKTIKAANGQMVVEVTAPVVREVLNTAGLNSLWNFAETREAAFTALGLQADGRRQMSIVTPLVGSVALGAALAGLAATLLLRSSESVEAIRVLMPVQLASAGIALLAGLWTVIRGTGVRRGLGAGMVIASALLAVIEVMNVPR